MLRELGPLVSVEAAGVGVSVDTFVDDDGVQGRRNAGEGGGGEGEDERMLLKMLQHGVLLRVRLHFFYLYRIRDQGSSNWSSNTSIYGLHAYFHTCMQTCKRCYILPQIRACIHAYMHTCIHAYMHTDTHTYTHANIHTYTHTYIHTYIHTFIHTHINTYINTH